MSMDISSLWSLLKVEKSWNGLLLSIDKLLEEPESYPEGKVRATLDEMILLSIPFCVMASILKN